MKFFICFVIIIACIADKARDVYRSHADWRTRYPRLMLIPRALWLKFQDRWHIAKQIGFLIPLATLDFIIWWVFGDWLLALAMVMVGYLAWEFVIDSPEGWDD